ncbi:MAG: sialidase family protein [Vicinamibacterales bacterium]
MMSRSARFLAVVGASAVLMGSAACDVPPVQAAQEPSSVELVHPPDGGIQPQVAMDADGGVHLLYFKGDPAHGDLFYARRNRDGRFSSPMRVNAHVGSAIATGSIRGGHLAIGRNGRVHVAWPGSSEALPRLAGQRTPVLYTRMNDARTGFEPERNVVQLPVDLDGGAIAADPAGHVFVAWHAGPPGAPDEANRRIWIARSTDDGRTFAKDVPVSDPGVGACGCCGIGAVADRQGRLFMLFRSATAMVHRDTYLLSSRDAGLTFASRKVQDWTIGACPMSTFSVTDSVGGPLAAWETDGQVHWARVDPVSSTLSAVVTPPGTDKGRKHPAVAANGRGETILAWAEGTSWNKGGAVAWQVFRKDGTPTAVRGRVDGVPAWGLVATVARADGGFTIVY